MCELKRRHHLILVPGFAGFDILGPLNYYRGVNDVVSKHNSPPLCFHCFESFPTASVATRATGLMLWLAKQIEHGIIRKKDRIHFVGHSTGGLDIRWLISELYAPNKELILPDIPVLRPNILEKIKSVQCVSTPHRGTNIALWVERLGALPKIMLRTVFLALHHGGPPFWSVLGRSLNTLFPKREDPNVLQAIVDILHSINVVEGDFKKAQARGVLYALLRWLNEMATDFAAIKDLLPHDDKNQEPQQKQSPAQRIDLDKELLGWSKIRHRSIVTAAKPDDSKCFDLYSLLHLLLNQCLPPILEGQYKLPKLLEPEEMHSIDSKDNDGIVNSVSMVWPGRESSFFVEADHGDIIGHFGQHSKDSKDKCYNLLPSASGFDHERFYRVWQDILAFARPQE